MIRKLTLGMIIVMSLPTLLWAGSLNPPAAPTAGTMKPLDQVEPRTPITRLPYTISASGSYYLTKNLTAAGTGITINADDITLDLCGFTLSGNGTGYGITAVGRQGIEIRNGTIRNFSSGIYDSSSSGDSYQVLNVRLFGCVTHSIYLSSNNCRVEACTIAEGSTPTIGTMYGIRVGVNSIVSGNRIYNNGVAGSNSFYGIYTPGGSVISGNTIYKNGIGSVGASVYGIMAGASTLVSENSIYDNFDNAVGADIFGIYAGTGCTVLNNRVYHNGTNAGNDSQNEFLAFNAIKAVESCLVKGNSCCNNGDSSAIDVFGINTGHACTISENTAQRNGLAATDHVYGILAGFYSSVIGNSVHGNGLSGATGSIYGIYLSGYNAVTDNTSHNNGGTNMSNLATCSYGTNVPQY